MVVNGDDDGPTILMLTMATSGCYYLLPAL